MRIFITGGRGQLGQALVPALQAEHELAVTDLPELDVTDAPQLQQALAEARPDLVLHAAAYTDVDGCARDPALAYRVNGLGTQNVALAAQAVGAALLHISTNEVFAGDEPAGYLEWQPLNPINAYGRSKAAAEFHVRHLAPRHYIVRTAWLYGPGGRNFIHAILRRAGSGEPLRVVTDEVGNPTYTADLARAIARLVMTGQFGTYHLVNEGACSRWALANEVLRLAGLDQVPNRPILSRAYRRDSTPPPFGALRNQVGAAVGLRLRPWQQALAEFVGAYRNQALTPAAD